MPPIQDPHFHFQTEILERFYSTALRMITDAPWFVPNTVIRRNLHTPTVKEEIRRYNSQYSARLSAHPNDLIVNLMELPDNRRLMICLPNLLCTCCICSSSLYGLVFKSHSQKPQQA
jgi:hypothetical protein